MNRSLYVFASTRSSLKWCKCPAKHKTVNKIWINLTAAVNISNHFQPIIGALEQQWLRQWRTTKSWPSVNSTAVGWKKAGLGVVQSPARFSADRKNMPFHFIPVCMVGAVIIPPLSWTGLDVAELGERRPRPSLRSLPLGRHSCPASAPPYMHPAVQIVCLIVSEGGPDWDNTEIFQLHYLCLSVWDWNTPKLFIQNLYLLLSTRATRLPVAKCCWKLSLRFSPLLCLCTYSMYSMYSPPHQLRQLRSLLMDVQRELIWTPCRQKAINEGA